MATKPPRLIPIISIDGLDHPWDTYHKIISEDQFMKSSSYEHLSKKLPHSVIEFNFKENVPFVAEIELVLIGGTGTALFKYAGHGDLYGNFQMSRTDLTKLILDNTLVNGVIKTTFKYINRGNTWMITPIK